jgi:hypothetical protein
MCNHLSIVIFDFRRRQKLHRLALEQHLDEG